MAQAKDEHCTSWKKDIPKNGEEEFWKGGITPICTMSTQQPCSVMQWAADVSPNRATNLQVR